MLLSQWSLSEHRGILRVASTEVPLWWGGPQLDSETAVTTLDERDGALAQVGHVGGLGRGERVDQVGSRAMSGTSSRSGRSTRSTRSTSRLRRVPP